MRVLQSMLFAGAATCVCLHPPHAFADSSAPAARSAQRVTPALKREAVPAPASPARAAAPPEASKSPPVKSDDGHVFYWMAGLWGVTVTTGTVLLVAGASVHEDAAKLRDTLVLSGGAPATCAGSSAPSECTDLKSRLDTSSDLIWAGLGMFGAAGTTLAATAIYGLVLHTKKHPQVSLQLVPIVTAEQRMVSIAGTW